MRFTHELYFSSLPSTNTFLKENYREFPNFTVVVAKRQTAGRGRLGRTWHSGDDLLLSVLIKDRLAPQDVPKLSLVAAAALWKALSAVIPAEIKWPNDIVCGGKKIAGILSEAIIASTGTEAVIIGFGVNVNTRDYPAELADKAASLLLLTGAPHDIEGLKEKLLENLDLFYGSFLEGGNDYLDVCRKHSSLIGKEIVFDDFQTQRQAKVLDILENGSLLLEADGETRACSSGEVTLAKIYQRR